MAEPPKTEAASLVRGLGTWDAALITVGSILGTGIFITTGDIARVLPHAGLILLVWVTGGLLTLAGALTYAELGTMFPSAGGQYHFLREAYGPIWGFLFGWASFLVIMTGGLATLAVGFGEYLGFFVPFFSTRHVLFEVPLGHSTWGVNGGQLAGALALGLLTIINYRGLREGAGVQNVVTAVKIACIVGLGLLGLAVPVQTAWTVTAPLPPGNVSSAFGVAMIAAFWAYDGWYGVTNLAGEMREPERDVPRGLVLGTAIVVVLYVVLNLVYLRALPVGAMGGTGRIGEAAAAALFGSAGARFVSLGVLVSTFGCISSTILYCTRIYLPMARDGVFFSALARIHPRHRTPAACILAQGTWAILLAFSGTYQQLYTYVVFAVVVFHAATGVAVFVLRRSRPDAPRPYRTWGYPWVPGVFVLASMALVVNTLAERPVESLIGLGLLALGLPAYAWWRRGSPPAGRAAA